MTRSQLFAQALSGCQRLLATYPAHPPLQSAVAQLEYLIALESGARSDRHQLRDINIGLLTVRELEVLDPELADTLYAVSEQAELMSRDSK